MITLEYTTNEQDYLAFHLFESSVSARSKRTRRRARVNCAALFLVLSVFSIIVNKALLLAILFLLAAVLWYLFWPLYEKRFYNRHFKAVIKEAYGRIFGKPTILLLTDDQISDTTNGNETSAPLSTITAINEITGYIFIKLQTGMGIIVPANSTGITEFKAKLHEIATTFSIPYTVYDKWAWNN